MEPSPSEWTLNGQRILSSGITEQLIVPRLFAMRKALEFGRHITQKAILWGGETRESVACRPCNGENIPRQDGLPREAIPLAMAVHLQALAGRLQTPQLLELASALQHKRALKHHQHAHGEERIIPAGHEEQPCQSCAGQEGNEGSRRMVAPWKQRLQKDKQDEDQRNTSCCLVMLNMIPSGWQCDFCNKRRSQRKA